MTAKVCSTALNLRDPGEGSLSQSAQEGLETPTSHVLASEGFLSSFIIISLHLPQVQDPGINPKRDTLLWVTF